MPASNISVPIFFADYIRFYRINIAEQNRVCGVMFYSFFHRTDPSYCQIYDWKIECSNFSIIFNSFCSYNRSEYPSYCLIYDGKGLDWMSRNEFRLKRMLTSSYCFNWFFILDFNWIFLSMSSSVRVFH